MTLKLPFRTPKKFHTCPSWHSRPASSWTQWCSRFAHQTPNWSPRALQGNQSININPSVGSYIFEFIILTLFETKGVLFAVKYNISERQRRRMETEDKAKVVVSVWGQNLFNFLPRYSCFASVHLKEKDDVNRFSQIDRDKTASVARNWTHFAPQNRLDDLCLVFCFHHSSMVQITQCLNKLTS